MGLYDRRSIISGIFCRLLALSMAHLGLIFVATQAVAQVDTTGDLQATAQAQTAAASTVPLLGVNVAMEVVDPSIDSPTGSTARLYRIDQTPQGLTSAELRARWWWGNGVGSLGAGADWAATPAGSVFRPLRPVVGLRANVSDQTRLVYEVRGAASTLPSTAVLGATEREARLALEFKSARNPVQNLRNGLFRVQLSNTSALFLKPRSGGMVVSYRSQF